jgi:hypothetical protein
MAKYKTIPVDEETYQMLVEVCRANERKQGAQVKALVRVEHERLAAVKLMPKVAMGDPEVQISKLPKGE